MEFDGVCGHPRIQRIHACNPADGYPYVGCKSIAPVGDCPSPPPVCHRSPPPLGRGHAGSQIAHPSPPQRRDTLARSQTSRMPSDFSSRGNATPLGRGHSGSQIAHHSPPPGRYHSGSQIARVWLPRRRDTLARRRQGCPQISLHGATPFLWVEATVGLRAQASRDVIRLRAVRRQRMPSESSSRGKLTFPVEGCVESCFQPEVRVSGDGCTCERSNVSHVLSHEYTGTYQ